MPLASAVEIAPHCHEMNRLYCLRLGDTSQVRWEDAPDWQQQSAIKGVQLILDNPATTPADSHASWYTQKLADGWVYGPIKDATKKQHPCMVAYAELPLEQRTKDYLFGSTVRALAGLPSTDPLPTEVVELLAKLNFVVQQEVPPRIDEKPAPAKTLGQVAYEAYFEHSGGKSLASGAPLPTWGQQRPEISAGWDAAAAAVINSYDPQFEKLRAFKDFVHQRLDAAGVPEQIDDHHLAEGCRIGGRLDWLIERVKA